jgi:hypothetical protein
MAGHLLKQLTPPEKGTNLRHRGFAFLRCPVLARSVSPRISEISGDRRCRRLRGEPTHPTFRAFGELTDCA